MFFQNGKPIVSANDLSVFLNCPFASAYKIDAILGRVDELASTPDPIMNLTVGLGLAHEAKLLSALKEEHGSEVLEIPNPNFTDFTALQEAHEQTVTALRARQKVIYQGTFLSSDFIGFADFLIWDEAFQGYQIWDTKLSRKAKITALLQLCAYADQLESLGIATTPAATLVLGDNSHHAQALAPMMQVFRHSIGALRSLIDQRRQTIEPLAWANTFGGPQQGSLRICGACEVCEHFIILEQDLLQVAGMRLSQRAVLNTRGITSIEQLAKLPESDVAQALDTRSLLKLQQQASTQVASVKNHKIEVRPRSLSALEQLPVIDPGDIYFDFEGDPLYQEDSHPTRGIDYLFGFCDRAGKYTKFWAHDYAGERQAFDDFVRDLQSRLQTSPNMHVYHYAPYERTHLGNLSTRYGIHEEFIDELFRKDVLVDLYPLVQKAFVIGVPSYSIKKLEPLYMGDKLRDSAVSNGADSVEQYITARELLQSGAQSEAEEILQSIADYNAYDCLSTLRLHEWLISQAQEAGLALKFSPSFEDDAEGKAVVEVQDPRVVQLLDRASSCEDETLKAALEVASAAIGFHKREAKSFWWEHFNRLSSDISDWPETRDIFRLDPYSPGKVISDWHLVKRSKRPRRTLQLNGVFTPGSKLTFELQDFFAIYDEAPGKYTARRVSASSDGDSITLFEVVGSDEDTYSHFPIALTPNSPPNAEALDIATDKWIEGLLTNGNSYIDPVFELLKRSEPRLKNGSKITAFRTKFDEDVQYCSSATLALDNSFFAVQGPPGTGKTYLASHVIKNLVENHNQKIGVVAQSHAVVENLLERVVKTGLDSDLVAKFVRDKDAEVSFQNIPRDRYSTFVSEHKNSGFVLGGTAWDFSNANRMEEKSLDLLVVDEAGQFSLAFLIAVSRVTKNLLLLGDPQQLPQVSQGSHPFPVNTSTLSWLSQDAEVLDPRFGLFLSHSYRMHPDVCAPVSQLSYDHKLLPAQVTASHDLTGVQSGVFGVPLRHHGNSVLSIEEAHGVLELINSLIGKPWKAYNDPDAAPLGPGDIMVVTPYNAQLNIIKDLLAANDLAQVPVGTVDKFQGQEAVVAIISMAASSGSEVNRGMDFLLLKNRLNVSVSRAKWAAYVLYSPLLFDYLPTSPEQLVQLGNFMNLVALEHHLN